MRNIKTIDSFENIDIENHEAVVWEGYVYFSYNFYIIWWCDSKIQSFDEHYLNYIKII
jgi:hypothetical protein